MDSEGQKEREPEAGKWGWRRGCQRQTGVKEPDCESYPEASRDRETEQGGYKDREMGQLTSFRCLLCSCRSHVSLCQCGKNSGFERCCLT